MTALALASMRRIHRHFVHARPRGRIDAAHLDLAPVLATLTCPDRSNVFAYERHQPEQTPNRRPLYHKIDADSEGTLYESRRFPLSPTQVCGWSFRTGRRQS